MALYSVGLAMGLANAVRHRIRGYRSPRPPGVEANDHAEKIVERWLRHVDPVGKRVLEVGPGSDLLTGELLMRRGAASYTAVDTFELAAPQPGLKYVVTTFPELPALSGEYDLIVSNAVLEHLDDVAATFARLAEATADDGLWCHYVDAKSHMRWIKDRDPLNLLRYSPMVYSRMNFPGVPNRLRASDFVAAAERAGVELDVTAGKVADPVYLDGLRTYRKYRRSDLELMSFMLTGRLARARI